jgi:hypothetical protein
MMESIYYEVNTQTQLLTTTSTLLKKIFWFMERKSDCFLTIFLQNAIIT